MIRNLKSHQIIQMSHITYTLHPFTMNTVDNHKLEHALLCQNHRNVPIDEN